MADSETTSLPPLSPEHRKICAAQFERANQVIASGNYDYGIQLLMSCCKLDPGNLVYRQTLRRTEKTKYKNNLRGSRLALLSTSAAKAKIKAAKRGRNYLKVLEHGEEVLAKNPWDVSAQMDMAEATDALNLVDVAIWILEQARQKDPNLAPINRSLARLYEKRGNFAQAIALWELVRKVDPADIEASHKAKDLAASETIIRGQYEKAVSGAAPGVEKGPVRKLDANERLTREISPLLLRIENDPTKVGSYLDLAALYRKHSLPDKARAVLENALGPTGNHFQIALELAELDLEPFRQNLAITEEKLRSDPGNEELRRIRHDLKKEINARELELFRTKADRFPGDLGHRLELGVRLLKAAQVDEAIRELQLARADTRLSWKALMYLGHCFKSRNNWRLARRNFEDSLQGLPPTETSARKEILFMLAQGCADANELAEAIEFAHELANIDYTYRNIGRLLDDWQARLQQA